jgi:hypothetical protein
MLLHDSTNDELKKQWPWCKVKSFEADLGGTGASHFTFEVSGQIYTLEVDKDGASMLKRIFEQRLGQSTMSAANLPAPLPPTYKPVKCDGCGHPKTKEERAAGGAVCTKCRKNANMACKGCHAKFYSATQKTKYCLLCRSQCNAACTKCKNKFHSAEKPAELLCGPCREDQKTSWGPCLDDTDPLVDMRATARPSKDPRPHSS